MFKSLSDKLQSVFDRLSSKGKLTESDVNVAMREVRLALLEADVNYKVVKEFVDKVKERSIGAEVMQSLTPAQMARKIKALEKEMYGYAKDLEFEKAAAVRDRLKELQMKGLAA